MTHIEELEKEIQLTKELIELRKQLALPYITYVPYAPYHPPHPYPIYVGDPIPPFITTTGGAVQWF